MAGCAELDDVVVVEDVCAEDGLERCGGLCGVTGVDTIVQPGGHGVTAGSRDAVGHEVHLERNVCSICAAHDTRQAMLGEYPTRKLIPHAILPDQLIGLNLTCLARLGQGGRAKCTSGHSVIANGKA